MSFVSFVGFISLYATLVCIACSQLEKLRANLVDIRQKENASEKDSGAEFNRKAEEEEQMHTSKEVFHHMRDQLHDCISHHQNTLEYDYYVNNTNNK